MGSFKKRGFFISILFVAVVLISLVGYFYLMQSTKERMFTQRYAQIAKELQTKIDDLIEAKQKSTMGLAITLAARDAQLVHYIRDRNVPNDYLLDIVKAYKKYTLYKNIWIQIIDKNGISLYRSWSQDYGDNLANVREDIHKMLQRQKVMTSVSIGNHDLSIKAIAPVFDGQKFIGMIEMVSHFNSIDKRFQKNGWDSVVLADKKYEKQLIHPFTKKFVDGYYVANLDAKKEHLEYLHKYGIKKFFQDGYVIDGDRIIVSHLLQSDGKTHGAYILFKPLQEIVDEYVDDFVFKWIVFGVMIFMILAGMVNIYMYIVLRKQKKYYQKIVDSSDNLILLTDGKTIINTNKAFFRYFPKFRSLQDFKKQHSCICEYFVDEKGYIPPPSLQQENWIQKVLQEPEKEHKIKLNVDGKIYYLLVHISLISDEKHHYSVILSDITQLEKYKNDLEKLIITDPLTQIGNRRFYNIKIEETLQMAQRYKFAVSIIIFDIDHFKKVNDTYGHKTGDNVLVEAVEIVKESIRDVDIFCRIGGEEFVLITPHTDLDAAVKIAEKIRKRVEEKSSIVAITMSFGVAQYVRGEDADNLLVRADKALYKAKENGRNQVVF